MTHDELVEKVAHRIAEEILKQDGIEGPVFMDGLKLEWLDQGEVDFGIVASAAVSIAMEEAAKVANDMANSAKTGDIDFDDGWEKGAAHIATALRQLGRKG